MATSRQLLEELVTASLNYGDSGEKSRAAAIVPVLQQSLSGEQLSDLAYWLLFHREITPPALKRVDALIQSVEPAAPPVRVVEYNLAEKYSRNVVFPTHAAARIWTSKRVSDAIKDGQDARWASPRYAVVLKDGQVQASYTLKYNY